MVDLGLEHATIKDNIIFGSSAGYDEARYRSVIEACALVRDLEVLDARDLTGKLVLASILTHDSDLKHLCNRDR